MRAVTDQVAAIAQGQPRGRTKGHVGALNLASAHQTLATTWVGVRFAIRTAQSAVVSARRI